MTPMRKNSYWYHQKDSEIPFMVKLKKVVMPSIELIQDNNKTNKFPSSFKGYADMNPRHQIILDKIEGMENINHEEYVGDEN